MIYNRVHFFKLINIFINVTIIVWWIFLSNIKAKSAFDKNDTLCLKGVAIILLMCIHCFGSESRFAGYEFNFGPFPRDLFIDLAYYCKICVSIFAFISGYGLYLSAKKNANSITETNKWYISRLIKTLSGFWFIYPLSYLFGNPIKRYFGKGIVRGCVYMILDFFGVSHFFGTSTLNATWWYMSAAVVFILLIPFLVRGTEKIGWFSVFVAVVVIPRVLFNGKFFGAMGIYTFILPVYFGALFAEYKVFEKIDRFKLVQNKVINEILLLVCGALIILLSICIWIWVPCNVLWEYHYGVAPLFIIIFCNRFIFKKRGLISKGVRAVFAFLGKHSMNIFLFHTCIRVRLFKDFIYSLKYPILTILALLLLSLGVSVIVELVKKLVRYDKGISFVEKKLVSLVHEKK